MKTSEPDNDYLQQLRWRSRRGLLELELLLLPFAQQRLAELPPEQLSAYEQLLNCEDLDIYDWLQQRSNPADAALQNIVNLVRDHQLNR